MERTFAEIIYPEQQRSADPEDKEAQGNKKICNMPCRIRCSHSGGYEEYHLMGYNGV
jgi:hypothetical protein